MANCKSCGRRIENPRFKYCLNCTNNLPREYLREGYFDQNGNLHCDLVTETAMEVAEKIGLDRKMGTAQLRRFYGHAKNQLTRLQMSNVDFDVIRADVQKLRAFAAEARGKSKIPTVFFKFIETNLSKVVDEKSFVEGFMEHFQAVVAYFYYLYPKS